MLSTEPIHINQVLQNDDDLIYEVRLMVPGRKGLRLLEHWFDDTRVEAEMRELTLIQTYSHMLDNIRIKVQPHILKTNGRRFQMDHENY